ncbi:GNAT family N-acetyltransferase [Roseobacter sp. YSTF-M11]|uniref:GNAT family N-acetyltransferase n=2 Tax=Roseobacter insulae TaxID=2859783 RepID=A0A9X1FTZ0_9RHOB|nr:GNAT family N-acetyltransferase [Roseobacter insulae]MBW4707769.1 GNAT family N-acetyltransferase [Roseobacter insulae]
MEQVKIRNFTSGDRDWLVDQHGTLYAQGEGFDDSFGALVAEILDAFLSGHDPAREAGWIAEEDGHRLGSIFCVKLTETTAKLRLFLLVPQARGRGLGKQLLRTCMDFAKGNGYTDMQLWTHESHAAACGLYRSAGWQMVSSKPVHSFGQDLVEQSWIYRF